MKPPSTAGVILTLLLTGCVRAAGGPAPGQDTPKAPAPRACATDAAPALGKAFHLAAAGETKIADENLALTFERLLGDSRCPVGVVCVWEGEGKIRVIAERPPAAAAMLELSTRAGSPVTYEGYRVELIGLAPHPEAGHPVPPMAYCAEIKVVRAD